MSGQFIRERGLGYPINYKDHWKVVIVNLSVKTICLYDSIGHEQDDPVESSHLETIRNFIQQVYKFFGEKWTVLKWKHYIANETPKQLNAYDCGIFSFKFVDYILFGKPLSFSQDDMPRFRKEMTAEIRGQRLPLHFQKTDP